MPITHVLTNTHGNKWFLTAARSGEVIDTVTAPNQPAAAVHFAHLLPGVGAWEQRGHQFWFRVPQRVGGDCGIGL